MASDSTPWPYAGAPPPPEFNDAFLSWLKTVGDQLSIRVVEWKPISPSDLEYLRQDHDGPEPAQVAFFYKLCNPCENGVALQSRYAEIRGSGVAPFWPVDLDGQGGYVAFREDQATGISVTWIDVQGRNFSRARGLREYFLMTVAVEHEWGPRSANKSYAEVLNLPSVQRYSRASDSDILIHKCRKTAAAILAREISPIKGAIRIWDLTIEVGGATPIELHTFIYAASEWDDRPEMHSEFKRAIKEAARMLVDSESSQAG